MTTTTASTPDVEKIFNALETWINKRPGLEFADYGELSSYRAELRAIAKDKQRALKALGEARRQVKQYPDLLLDAFKRAFSGRLEWHLPVCDGEQAHLNGYLTYTTGQYWPTEYRKAAASVLECYVSTCNQRWAEENPTIRTYRSVEDVIEANRATGGHFFDKDTLRFFRSRIASQLYGGRYFVTSEQFVSSNGIAEPRRYTIREAKPDGSVDTVGGFDKFHTAREAVAEIKRLLKA